MEIGNLVLDIGCSNFEIPIPGLNRLHRDLRYFDRLYGIPKIFISVSIHQEKNASAE